MKKFIFNIFCSFSLALWTIDTQAQSAFEKGYFIDVHNQKTDCYLKSEAWKANDSITYRIDYKDTPRKKSLTEVHEVSIDGSFKIKRVRVSIDISGDNPPLLSYVPEPEWHQEILFLWTLVEGSTNLYAFEGDGLKRYFFNKQVEPIKQLVFKKYKTINEIKTNETYKQTLAQVVNCRDSTLHYFNSLAYDEAELIAHFESESQCAGTKPVIYPLRTQKTTVTSAPSLSAINKTEHIDNPRLSSKTKPAKIRYFGIEITQLLQQIINLNSDNTPSGNPFAIQYASNSLQTGRGISYGLSYEYNKFIDDSNFIKRETVNRTLTFRIGYERKTKWGKRWIALHGYDLVLGGSKLKTNADQGGASLTIETTGNQWGLGPRVGLMFGISDRIFMGTEATYYLRFIKDRQSIIGQPESIQKTTDLSLTLPITLFLSARIK